MKAMVQTKSFDSLSGGPRIPHLKNNVMNLLKCVDMSEEDQIQLTKIGFGNLINNGPQKSPFMQNKNRMRDSLDLRKEKEDELKASTFTFKIVVFKTDKCAKPQEIPKNMSF